jgi:16S rRNA (cytosine967-C5)-methyltransferase
MIAAVLEHKHPLEDALAAADGLEPRDRAFARAIAATVIRHLGEIEHVLAAYLEKPLPRRSGPAHTILLSAAAQLLFLDTPPHAAVGLAVEQARADTDARHFEKLVNAVLRRVAQEGRERLTTCDAVTANVPDWLLSSWRAAYGEETARAVATAQLSEAALDLTAKADAAAWAEKLGGTLLPTGSIRLAQAGRIEDLAGYADGAWWVQDAAAALPARLLGDVDGLSVADLCAAPGGKTAQLAAAGARVTAVDASAARLTRVSENLARLSLTAEIVAADVTSWQPGQAFDAVLLDLPCTATGTIRRHPDILRLRRPGDAAALAAVQSRLLAAAAPLLRPGGTLVACVCSLQPEEGAEQIARFLAAHPDFARRPVEPDDIAGRADWITPAGDLQTLPCCDPLPAPAPGGMDGFHAARLVRAAA